VARCAILHSQLAEYEVVEDINVPGVVVAERGVPSNTGVAIVSPSKRRTSLDLTHNATDGHPGFMVRAGPERNFAQRVEYDVRVGNAA